MPIPYKWVYPGIIHAAEWNNIRLYDPCHYLIFEEGGLCYAYGQYSGSTDYSGSSTCDVINNAISSTPAGSLIHLLGPLNITGSINITKDLDVAITGKITWVGSADTGSDKYFFLIGNSAQPVSIRMYGGELCTGSWSWNSTTISGSTVYPMLAYVTTGVFRDLIVNTTIFLKMSTQSCLFDNIYQKGQGGGQGHDFGINIGGYDVKNVTVNKYIANLITEYQGGFVIQNSSDTLYKYDNITLKGITISGSFGSFVHWYIPKNSTQQQTGGRVVIEDFHVELVGIPKWGHFAIFPWMDSEFVSGTYSGDFGQVIVRNGEIKGPSQTLIGSSNGIHVLTLCDLETSGNNATVDATFENIKISGMRSWSDTQDTMTMSMRGRLTLRNIIYSGNWNLTIADSFGAVNIANIIIENCNFQVGTYHTIGLISANSGTSYVTLKNNKSDQSISVFQTSGHTLETHEIGNDRLITVTDGTTRFGIHDLMPVDDNLYYLGRWSPQKQWLALYLADNGYIIWNNSPKIYGSGSNFYINAPLYIAESHYPTINSLFNIGSPSKQFNALYLGYAIFVSGSKVIGIQQPAISNTTVTGTAQDSDARTAINSILVALRTHGLIAT